MVASLRSKRFRLVSEQRKTEERDSRFWPREKWNKSQKMKAIFPAVFGSRSSFFAPKPYGNACYAGYIVACDAAGPRTRLNHLYSPSALYTEDLECLRRR